MLTTHFPRSSSRTNAPPFDKKLAKIQSSLLDWKQLAAQLDKRITEIDAHGLLTDNEELASMVGYHRREVVIDLAPLLWDKETSQRRCIDFGALINRRGIFFTDNDASMDLELRFLFENVRALPPIAADRGASFKVYLGGRRYPASRYAWVTCRPTNPVAPVRNTVFVLSLI